MDVEKPRLELRFDDGINALKKEDILERPEAIKLIEESLTSQNLLLVRSPSYTGKTSLATLLAAHFKKKAITAIFLSCLDILPNEDTFQEFWIKNTGKSWEKWLDTKDPLVIVLDEVQLIYPCIYKFSNTFWTHIKKKCDPHITPHIKLVAFAAYPDMIRENFVMKTPFKFPAEYGTDLLFCSKEETLQLIKIRNNQWIREKIHNLQINEKMAEYLHSITEGHIGFLSRTLHGIFEKFRDISTMGEPIPEKSIAEYLIHPDYIFFLTLSRGAPSLDNLSENERFIIEQILLYGEFSAPVDNDSLKSAAFSLVQRWVLQLSQTKFHFISKLIHLICFYKFASSPHRLEQKPKSFEEFLIRCLKALKPSYLQNCLGKGREYYREEGKSKERTRILEQTWQKEFYRIATSQLPQRHFISCDVGHLYGSKGLVDFYINDSLKWMIEIDREGDRLKNHVERFDTSLPDVPMESEEKRGKKRQARKKKKKEDKKEEIEIEEEHINRGTEFGIYREIERNEWVVIDFRHRLNYVSRPISYDNLWIVRYDDDFKSAIIERKGKEDLEINFMGDSIPSFSLGSQEWTVLVKKEGDRLFKEIFFPSKPSFDGLVKEICDVLKIEQDKIEHIAKGNKEVEERNMKTLTDGQELTIYMKQDQ